MKTHDVHRELNITENSPKWTDTHHITGVPLRNRHIYLIDAMYKSYLQGLTKDGVVVTDAMREKPDLFCDYRQCIARNPKQLGHPCGAHQSNGDYSYEGQRVLRFQDPLPVLVNVITCTLATS